MKTKPLFVVVDGIDGGGKGTQISLLSSWFANNGYKVRCSREPGGTDIGTLIRQILAQFSDNPALSSVTELLLLIADRFQHIKSVILPFFESAGPNDVLILDRFFFSTWAYQMCGSNLKNDQVCREFYKTHFLKLQELDLEPDLYIIFDLDPVIAQKRLDSRPGEKMGYDNKPLDYKQRVREGFLELAHHNLMRSVVIDASKTAEQIHEIVIKAVSARILLH
jgi:dTMP kinase